MFRKALSRSQNIMMNVDVKEYEPSWFTAHKKKHPSALSALSHLCHHHCHPGHHHHHLHPNQHHHHHHPTPLI